MAIIDTQEASRSGVAHEGDARAPASLATFEVGGEAFVSAGDAARAILEACDLSPSSAYQTVQRAVRAGRVRTVQATPRVRWYHRADVAQLAARLRGAA